jgi:carbonic anhydrase
MLMKGWLALSVWCLCSTALAADWDYSEAKGPSRWATLNPAYHTCADGLRQSPIDISTSQATKTLMVDPIHYQSMAKGRIKSDHGDAEVSLDQPNTHQTLEWQQRTYALQDFHFHWPSENYLNGQRFPLELHLVNRAPDGSLAVIGVFFKVGDANPAIDKLIKGLRSSGAVSFNIKELLPSSKTFYQFQGSLTVPPCGESVQWFVLQMPVVLSKEQLEALKLGMPESNARPLQPLHDRTIVKYEL